MASTLAASLSRPIPTAVRGLGHSKLTAHSMCLPVLQRTARCTRTSVVVRAQQQQSKAEKPELAQVLLLPCVVVPVERAKTWWE